MDSARSRLEGSQGIRQKRLRHRGWERATVAQARRYATGVNRRRILMSDAVAGWGREGSGGFRS